MALTGRQQRFVQEYLVDLNATEAARRAGYSRNTAASQSPRLLNHPSVKELIEAQQSARAERTNLTADWVVTRLRDVYDTAMQASEDDRPNLSAANKALELLGKHTGAYEPHVSLVLPAVQQAEDAVSAMSAVLSAVASGQITPSQGQTVGSLIETCRRTIETEDLARRMENLEQARDREQRMTQIRTRLRRLEAGMNDSSRPYAVETPLGAGDAETAEVVRQHRNRTGYMGHLIAGAPPADVTEEAWEAAGNAGMHDTATL